MHSGKQSTFGNKTSFLNSDRGGLSLNLVPFPRGIMERMSTSLITNLLPEAEPEASWARAPCDAGSVKSEKSFSNTRERFSSEVGARFCPTLDPFFIILFSSQCFCSWEWIITILLTYN